MTPPQPPPRSLLEPLLDAQGLPWPQSIRSPERVWVHANYWLEFGPDARPSKLLLRRAMVDPGYDSLANEATALAIVQALGDLPVAKQYRVLPPGALPWPAAISEVLPGQDGARWSRRVPPAALLSAQLIGRVMAWLSARPLPSWGTRPHRGRFLPTRSTWAQEWRAHVALRAGQARAGGADIQPLLDRLLAAIETRTPALDGVSRFCLVHRDLSPANILLVQQERKFVLSGVVDWEGAMSADPLCEWAQVLQAPVPTLGHVLMGFGPDRVRQELLQPGALVRLELYLLTRALARLGFSSLAMFQRSAVMRAQALEYAMDIGTLALEEGGVERRLREALALGDKGEAPSLPHPDPVRVLRRRALDLLGSRVTLEAVPPVVGVLTLCRLIEEGADDEGLLRRGHAMLASVKGVGAAVAVEPVLDQDAWRRSLLALSEGAESLLLLPLTWLGVDALERAGSTSHASRRGLDALVRSLSALAKPLPSEQPLSATLATLSKVARAELGLEAQEQAPTLADVRAELLTTLLGTTS